MTLTAADVVQTHRVSVSPETPAPQIASRFDLIRVPENIGDANLHAWV